MTKIFGYKTYSFRDKDPIIDVLRTIIKDRAATFKDISEDSGVSKGTLSKWFYGEVKRPTHACVMAVARALGYEYRLVLADRKPRLATENGERVGRSRPGGP